MADGVLTVEVERRYAGGPTLAAAFELDLGRGEVLALVGPSGSGKTTLLRCVAGLERPDRGTIAADGTTWSDAAAGRFLRPQARAIGYLPQGYALFPHLSVSANIAYGIRDGSAGERRQRVADLVAALELSGLEGRRPDEISGGQRQRVALARALARRPLLLLLDEPLSALDPPSREDMRLELRTMLERFGTPAILVTHDRTEAIVMADRVGVMVEGRLRQLGSTDDVFARPADPTVARVVGVDVVAHGEVVENVDGLAIVRVDGRKLFAMSPIGVGSRVVVSVRPEDVVLVRADHPVDGLSARNRLQGRVTAVEPLGPLVRVALDVGFTIRALVTRPALEELGVEDGGELVAVVKAPSIHLIEVTR